MKAVLKLAAVAVALGALSLPAHAAPVGSNTVIRFSSDFAWLTGSSGYCDPNGGTENGSMFRWSVNGTNVAAGPVAEGLLLHFDAATTGAGGELPSLASGVSYTNGLWGSALLLNTNGALRYARANNLFLNEGTIEMWVALRAAGNAPVYTNASQVLWHYYVSGNEWMEIAQARDTGVLYAGGTVSGQWQSAYSTRASMRGWTAGQWHHLAYTFSATNNFMRFYLDGALLADSNEHHYWPPSTNAASFTIGCDQWGAVARYIVDEARVSGRVATSAEIAARAQRSEQPRANEVWLNTAGLRAGDELTFQFTPIAGVQTGATCSATLLFPGDPLTHAAPPSTLLPPGTATLALSVNSVTNTACRYALGSPLGYDLMTPFDTGAGGLVHRTLLTGLCTNANTLNHVYVRCAAYPDFLLHLRYRCLSPANPPFPRKGNLWGWSNFIGKGLPYMARIDLWLGADGMSADQIVQLRTLNPNIRVLSSMNAVENTGLPDDYYLKDIHGKKIEVWPGAYRLNLTKPYVAEYQAQFAYQSWLNSGCQADGVFFDNVFTTQSWLKQDIYGNAVQIDADENGVADDPTTFDAAWKAGVFHELETYRALMPNAVTSGHALDINEPTITNLFNGISIGFQTANVLDGQQSFGDVWNNYSAWCSRVRAPHCTMVESSPLDDLAYGYDYDPLAKAPSNTVAFARDYYPWMRFGLAFTLLNDGYFAHEWGDTDHGQDWWYDELDFNLGYPLGPAELLNTVPSGTNQVANGSFESAIASPWKLWADSASGYTATVTRVTDAAAAGGASARISVTATAGADWRIEFAEYNRALVAGQNYEVVFWAKATAPRPITLSTQKGSADWRSYGLSQTLSISTNWTEYTVRFTANATVTDSRLQFLVGAASGSVWLDDVRLRTRGSDIYRREFDNGLVLLNASPQPQTVNLGTGFRRLTGPQAARYEYILDDADPSFSTTGAWNVVTLDSGTWKAAGPFYHDWSTNCHQSTDAASLARWSLAVPTNDTYTIAAWWPAGPTNNWSTNVLYEIGTGVTVIASTAFTQRAGGDQWHALPSVTLAAGTNAWVRARAQDGLTFIADALHVRSASRYNDGTSAPSVSLQPLDGILLRREPGTYADRDHDGLPDFWEQMYFGDPTLAVASADPDGDGYTNLQEWLAGTDPTNSASFFRIESMQGGTVPGGWEISWPSVASRVYDVECTTNLAAGFTFLDTNLPATPAVNVYTDALHPGAGRMFYRIRARQP